MAKRVQRYRATAAAMALITGPIGELIVNLTRNSLHVHDGVTPGGHELGLADASNISIVSGAANGVMTPALLAELDAATTDIAALDVRLTTAEGDIVALEGRMTTAEASIAALESNAAGNLKAPVGTRMLFQQTSAPTGWTKETGGSYSNKALRLTIGTVSSGGVNTFTQVFGTKSTAADGSHSHGAGSLVTGVNDTNIARDVSVDPATSAATGHKHAISGSTATVGNHTHSIANMDLAYHDAIIAEKAA